MTKGRLKKELWISLFCPFLLCNFFNGVGRGIAFPSCLFVFLAGLSDVRQINRRGNTHTHTQKFNNLYTWERPWKTEQLSEKEGNLHLNTIEVEIARQSV